MGNQLQGAWQIAAAGMSAVGWKHEAASRAFGIAVLRQGIAIGSAGESPVSPSELEKLHRVTETVGRQAYLAPQMRVTGQTYRAGGPLITVTNWNISVGDVELDWDVTIEITDVENWNVIIIEEVVAAADEAAAAADEAAAAADEAADAAAEVADVAADALAADVVDVVDLLLL